MMAQQVIASKYAKGEYVDRGDLVLPDYIKTMMNAGDEDYIRTGIRPINPQGKEDKRTLRDLTMHVQEHRGNFFKSLCVSANLQCIGM